MRSIACIGTAAAIALLPMTARTTEPADSPIPKAIQALLSPQDTVVALKTAEPLGAEPSGTVIVVHHAGMKSSEGNPCEIMLLKPNGRGFTVIARNDHVVDCRHNQYPTRAATLGVQSNLEVTTNSFSYFNELARGGSTYTFAWSEEKGDWYVQQAAVTTVLNGDDDIMVYKTDLRYPDNLPWMTFGEFNPKNIRELLFKNRKLIQ